MKRLLWLFLLLLMAWAPEARATEITIISQNVPNFQQATAPRLRIYLLQSFITSDGKPLQAGAPRSQFFYKEIVCTLAAGVVTIPQFTIDSTTDGQDTNAASYSAWWFTATGTPIAAYSDFTDFKVPHQITSPSGCSPAGTCATWADLRTYNHTKVNVFEWSAYTKAETEARIAAIGANIVGSPLITRTPDGILSNEFALSSLADGLLKHTTGTPGRAIPGTDYEVPLTFSAPLDRTGNTVSCPTCGGGSITVREVDGIPSVNPVSTLEFAQAQGLVVTDQTGGVARVDLVGVPYTALASLTASRALVSSAGGVVSVSAVTSTEIGHVAGVTSSIQTQINAKQPLDAELTALAGLTSAADRLPYFTGIGTAGVTVFTAFGRSLVDDVDAATVRTTIGLGSVENTALSTWAGSTNLTTLGTIGTGTWNATAIGVGVGGTGANLSATGGANQFVRQSTLGGVFTVSAIADADVPDTITISNLTQVGTRNYSDLQGIPATFTPSAHGASAHTGNVLPGANQDLGAFYLDIGQIAAPVAPGAGVRRLFVDSGTGEISVRTSGGTTVSLESGGGGTPGGSTTQVQYNNAGAFGGVSGATSDGTTLTVTGGSHTALTGLGIRSTGTGAFDLTFANAENLTAGRTLTIAVNDAARTLTVSGNATVSGTNTGDQTISLTGDVTGSGTGSFAATIANNVVTFAKTQDIATSRLLGRTTAAAGDIEELTAGTGLTLASGSLSVAADSVVQRVEVVKNSGAVVGTRKQLNLVEGSNITLTVADDAINNQVDITIASSGGFTDPMTTAGDMIYRDGTNTTTRLAIGANGQVLKVSAGLPVWQAEGGGTAHEILSATHTDTVAATVVRGDLMIGNATPAWQRLAVGSANQVVASNGTDPAWTTLAKAHLPAAIAYEDEANSFTALQTVDPGTTPADAVFLSIAQPGVAGTRDSHNFVLRGASFDTVGHNADWKQFVDVTSNAGASTFTLQSRIDAAAFANRLTITDTGLVTAANFSGGGASLTGLDAGNVSAGLLAAARGGTGDDTSAVTGVPRIAAGNWTYDAGISHLAVSTSADLAGVLSDETGSGGGFVRATGPTISGGTHTAITSLGIRSTGTGAFDLTIANSENLTAPRTLIIAVNDAARTVTVAGNATISGTNTGDQTITLTGDVTGSGTGSFAATIAAQNSAFWLGKATDETGSGLWVFNNTPTLTTPVISGAISFPDNVRQTFNPGLNAAGLNVGAIAGDPDTPVNGDLWYDSTANELTARINGANVALGAGGGSLTVREVDLSPSVASVTTLEFNTGFIVADQTGGVARVSLNVLTGSAVFDPPSLLNGETVSTTVTVTGAVAGDVASASFTGALPSGVYLVGANVIAADTARVTFVNDSGTTQDIASGTLKVSVGPTATAPSVAWGGITGTLSNQTDLQSALDLKAALISPSFTTPSLGVATATSINKVTITAPATTATLTLVEGSSLVTAGANSITLTSTGATNVTLPTAGTLITAAGTEILTNKQYSPRVQSVASAATVTPSADANDLVVITAQAAGLTLANPSPSANRVQGQKLIIRIKDDGTARSITFGSEYRAMGNALPTTTVAGKTMYLGFIFSATDVRWDLVASVTEQ